MNAKSLQHLSQKANGVEVVLFTENGKGGRGFLTNSLVADFQNEYPTIRIKPNPDCHDRLIIFFRLKNHVLRDIIHITLSVKGEKMTDMKIDDKKEAKDILIELRESTGMNRKQFCEYFEIPYMTVSDWEHGKKRVPKYFLRLLEYYVRMEQVGKENSING